jgi:hypothetical protein
MRSPLVTVVLAVGLLFSAVVLFAGNSSVAFLMMQRGYAPEQPIAFSHRLHTGELQINCLYCHHGAETSRHAGIPATSICMNCHEFVTATLGAIRAEDEAATEAGRPPEPITSPEIQKIYDALALDADRVRDPARTPEPIRWIKVHNLADYVYFDHRPHVSAGLGCQRCHGAIETMERVHQVETLNMGWCVNCHRRINETGIGGRAMAASIDCTTCHY